MVYHLGSTLGLQYGFQFLRRVRDAPGETLGKTMGALGCYPKSLAVTVRACEAAGLVEPVLLGRGFELTDLGFRVLLLWEQIVGLYGEPVGTAPPGPALVAAGNGMARAFAKHALAPGERVVEETVARPASWDL